MTSYTITRHTNWCEPSFIPVTGQLIKEINQEIISQKKQITSKQRTRLLCYQSLCERWGICKLNQRQRTWVDAMQKQLSTWIDKEAIHSERKYGYKW